MNKLIHKSIAVFMATVVLMTTMSFTIDAHYCGENLVDFSFFHNVDTCGMEKAELASSCEHPEMSKKSCCSDKQFSVDGQDDLKDNFSKLTFEQQIFVTSFTYSYISLFEGTAFNKVNSPDPNRVKNSVKDFNEWLKNSVLQDAFSEAFSGKY